MEVKKEVKKVVKVDDRDVLSIFYLLRRPATEEEQTPTLTPTLTPNNMVNNLE